MTIYLILFQISEVALKQNPKQLGSFPREVTHKYFSLRPFHAQKNFTRKKINLNVKEICFKKVEISDQ